ncbi:flagellar FlbD family protein [Glaciibacter sp. 2TAF33]|uniref:flagellar FlbD family protein n=1 Tax=Glaciibacter sp. 2TAF33 TaxID=3233015 RepID=UPI003F8E7EF3
MIVVTRLNDSQFAINPDLIERIHSNPDTTLVMVDGAKYIVTESMDEVIERVAAYRARVIALAYEPQPTTQRGARQLGLVPLYEEDPQLGDAGEPLPLHPRRK